MSAERTDSKVLIKLELLSSCKPRHLSLGFCLEQSFQYIVHLHFLAMFRAYGAHLISPWLCWLNLNEVNIRMPTFGKAAQCFRAPQPTYFIFPYLNSYKTQLWVPKSCTVLRNPSPRRTDRLGFKQTGFSWSSAAHLTAWASTWDAMELPGYCQPLSNA